MASAKAVLLYSVVLNALLAQFALESGASDCGADWLPYNENELCFKLFDKQYLIYEKALEFCRSQASASFSPGPAAVKTASLQDFLVGALFKDDIFDNVWLGGRFSEKQERFEWWDESPLSPYDNWAPGNPRDLNDTDRCIEIHPPDPKPGSRGLATKDLAKWYDVPCRKRNLVLCQKRPTWPVEEIVAELIELRKQVVPVGFVYTEYFNSPSPQSIWPALTWEDITKQYAGNFFRAAGGGAAGWGIAQSSCAPKLSAVRLGGRADKENSIPESGWSSGVKSGDWSSGMDHHDVAMSFHSKFCEVRPKNLAIRIWKRIA